MIQELLLGKTMILDLSFGMDGSKEIKKIRRFNIKNNATKENIHETGTILGSLIDHEGLKVKTNTVNELM